MAEEIIKKVLDNLFAIQTEAPNPLVRLSNTAFILGEFYGVLSLVKGIAECQAEQEGTPVNLDLYVKIVDMYKEKADALGKKIDNFVDEGYYKKYDEKSDTEN